MTVLTSTIPAALPTTTACPICLATGIPADGKYIHYCTPRSGKKVLSREYVGYFDGQPINYGPDCLAIATELDHYVTDLLAQTAADTADMLADAAAACSPEVPLLVAPRCHTCGGEGDCPDCGTLEGTMLADLDGPVVAAIVHDGMPLCSCGAQATTQRDAGKGMWQPVCQVCAVEIDTGILNRLYCLDHGIVTPEQLAGCAA